MDKLKYVTYCGLYCRLCANMARIPSQASALQQTLTKGGWEHFGQDYIPEFKNFWKALNNFSQMGTTCPGCRGGCGYPGCEIRKCAKQHKVDICSSCEKFPCKHIQKLAQKYPTLIADAQRQQKVGLDKWIEEQELRYRNGVCYADFCCPMEEK